MPPRRIAFFGLFGVGNFGNEASLRSAIDVVARLAPDAELSCVCYFPQAVATEHGIPAHSMHMAGHLGRLLTGPRWWRALVRPLVEVGRWVATYRFLRRIDLLIVPGTGILDDFGLRPWRMPSDLYRWSRMARATRTRLAYVGVGAGPIRGRINRHLLRGAVRHADLCSYRDEGSRDYMTVIGRDTSGDLVVPDIVFGYPLPAGPDLPARDVPAVGVGAMAYFGWSDSESRGTEVHRRYVERVTELVGLLRGEGWPVRLLASDRRDVVTAAEVVALAPGADTASRLVAEPVASMDDVLREIDQTDVVVATRYHSVVSALLLGRPVVATAYGPRTRYLLEAVGLGDHCHDADTFRPATVVESVRTLLAGAGEHGPRIGELTREWRRQVQAELARVLDQPA